ncbi:MAG: DUF3140 domain-containing protein [Gluconacetobacter diazotrophicus]|nr:DUF3140 domain-containing protein [Gluconacetobacter diazotrophicus]
MATAKHDDAKSGEHDRIRKDFDEAVNMTPAALEKWLGTEDSQSVGWSDGENKKGTGGSEAVGHAMGRHIVEMKHKKAADLTDEDYAHMKKVTGYVHRHLKQKPKGDTEHSRWRYSLMNWGHDPGKD